MYLKEFEIRWNDIDANRHLANSAYTNLMSHTRIAFLNQSGFGQSDMAKYNIGPVAFYEHMYYFREVFLGKPIRVSLELMGLSKDGMFFEFHHNFYDSEGKNFAHAEMMGSWMDLKSRKLTALPEILLERFSSFERAKEFKILTKTDTRKFHKMPVDLI